MNLDELVGFYVKLGYSGFELKKIVEGDKRYAQLLKKRKSELARMGISGKDQKKYVLLADRDIIILKKCNKLEKTSDEHEKQIIKLIKTQLEEDWRRPLLNKLNEIERREKHVSSSES